FANLALHCFPVIHRIQKQEGDVFCCEICAQVLKQRQGGRRRWVSNLVDEQHDCSLIHVAAQLVEAALLIEQCEIRCTRRQGAEQQQGNQGGAGRSFQRRTSLPAKRRLALVFS